MEVGQDVYEPHRRGVGRDLSIIPSVPNVPLGDEVPIPVTDLPPLGKDPSGRDREGLPKGMVK